MTGQNQRAFKQRDDQHGDDRHRHHCEKLAHHAGHEEHRHEGEDSGGDRRGDGWHDFDRAVDGRPEEVLPQFPVRVDVLANDDRVIDDDTQRDQE